MLDMTPQMPSAEDAERMIVGSIILSPPKIADVAQLLASDDFYNPHYKAYYRAMLELHSEHGVIDSITIASRVGNITTANDVTQTALGLPVSTDLEPYIELVRDASLKRQLIRECQAIIERTRSNEPDVVKSAQDAINALSVTGSAKFFRPLSEILDTDVHDDLDRMHTGNVIRMPLGYEVLDNAIGGGLSTSDVMLLTADTGSGKSAFALRVAYNIASAGYPVAFVAGEMTDRENVKRLLSQLSGTINLNSKAFLTTSERAYLDEWATAIKGVPMYFEHRISDLSTLRTHIAGLVKQKGVKVLVIDYLQLFKVEKNDKRGRTERIAEASQEVKRIANEFDIAIIEVAQLNRQGAKSGEPTLHDLEGSGQLEKDASLVMILGLGEADNRDDATGKWYRDVSLRIVKGRNVGLATLSGKFYGQTVTFEIT